MIGQISAILAKDNMNIADLTNKSKGKYAYTMIDVDSEVPDGVVEELKQIGDLYSCDCNTGSKRNPAKTGADNHTGGGCRD